MHLLFEPPQSITTISDLWSLIEFIFYLPGNVLISWIAADPKFAYFFEITSKSANGAASFYISVITWVVFYINVSALKNDSWDSHKDED